MRMRRRGTATIDRAFGHFEFAHLLGAASRVDVELVKNVVSEPRAARVTSEPRAARVPKPLKDLAPKPLPDVVPAPLPDVPDIAVSRFADSGLDDDRLPASVKRRRRRRR